MPRRSDSNLEALVTARNLAALEALEADAKCAKGALARLMKAIKKMWKLNHIRGLPLHFPRNGKGKGKGKLALWFPRRT